MSLRNDSPVLPKTKRYTLATLLDVLNGKGIKVYSADGFNLKINTETTTETGIGHMSVGQVDALICQVMLERNLIPQSLEYPFPGSPTEKHEDWGWYLKPRISSEWEDGDFNLYLSMDMISWELIEKR